MSIVNVLRLIRQMGLTASYSAEFGEYRINYKKDDPRYVGPDAHRKGAGGTAYFTNDQTDAFATARFMAASEKQGAASTAQISPAE
jgi:hypothetical protein